jgi:transposase
MNSLKHETRWEGGGTGEAGETEGARRASGVSPARLAGGPRPIDPEVQPKPQRRQFSAAYKRRILQEVQACKGTGEISVVLRREGLYASHLSKWRKLEKQGALEALETKRGRKPDPESAARQRIGELERENQRLRGKLRQAEAIIEVQKKVSEILGIQLAPSDDSDARS